MENKPSIVPKGRYQLQYRGTGCLNCGHPLDVSDKYCPSCSQANSTKKLTIKDFFDEFFSSVFNYDSKLLLTLKALLLRPGSITLDYVEGKRVSYTNPFRFLLSLAIVYFLLLDFSGNYSDLDRYGIKNTDNAIEMNGPLNFSMNSNPKASGQNIEILDSLGITERIEKQQRFEQYIDSLIEADPKAYMVSLKDSSFMERISYKQDLFMTLIQRDTLFNLDDAVERYGFEKSFDTKIAYNMADSIIHTIRAPGSFVSSLIAKLPFATFLFLPVFAIFIYLVYIRKNYTYTDNLIFSFHNQSLLFILLIVSFLVDSIFNLESSWVFMLVFAVYLYKAMRRFYKQGRFKTILKYLFLNTIFFILAGVAAFFIIIGGVFTF